MSETTATETTAGGTAVESHDRLLRDLDDVAFMERYSCDRLTASILANRFRYVAAHMATKLRANAFSVVIRDMDDFCTTVHGPPEQQWTMPAASLTNPVHWGPVTDAVAVVLEELGPESLRPGDVVVANDSYRTGKHLNDTTFIRPLFHGDRVIGAVHVTAHQFDLGSRIPGGFDLMSRSIWEDGLLLAPMLLYSGGSPVRSTFGLIAANTRAPDAILADLQVIRSTLDLGEQLLMDSVERYGLDAYLGAIHYADDAADEEMARALRALPDGIYDGEHVMEGDGRADSPPYAIKVRLHKHGDRLEVDFSGTSQRSETALNCSWLDAKTGVSVALRLLFLPQSTPSSGALRNIDFLLPEGSLVNPHPPTSTMYYFSIVDAVIRATVDALNPAIGPDAIASDTPFGGGGHRAAGLTADGDPWEVTTAAGSPATFPKGATKAGDADGYGLLPWLNMAVISAEVLELGNPQLLLECEAVADTAGAGYHRGGAAMASGVQYVHAGAHHHGSARHQRGAKGVYGGRDGVLGGTELFDGDEGSNTPLGSLALVGARGASPGSGERTVDPAEEIVARSGAIFRSVTPSGAGWGDPFERQAAQVLRDVRDGYVTVAGAARDYGVVVVGDPARDPEHLTVDQAATSRLRGTRR